MTADAWTAIFAGATALFTAALAATGIWALVYAKRQLAESRESDKVQHLIRFIEQFENDPMVQYRTAVARKRLEGQSFPPEAQRILGFFETIGLLVRRGFLDEYDVWSSFSYWMFNVYGDFRDDIEQEQKADAAYYRDFCDLIERMREIEAEPPASNSGRPSRDEIREFWQDELDTVPGSPVRKRRAQSARSGVKKSGGRLISSPAAAPIDPREIPDKSPRT